MQTDYGCEQFHERLQVPDHDGKIGGGVVLFMEKGNVSTPSDSDSLGEESWDSWDSWIGWDEIDDPRRMRRPGESRDMRTREAKCGSTEKSGPEEHISVKAEEPGSTRKVGRGWVEGVFED